MPTNAQDNVYGRAGETLTIDINVRNSDGDNMVLIGANAKFGIRIGSSMTIKDCTIVGSTVTATLTDEETMVLNGNYKYEIILETIGGEKKSLAYGIIVVTESLIDEIYTIPDPTP